MISKLAANKFHARSERDFQEINVLQASNENQCRNVVKFVQAIEDKKHFYIITEFVSGGTLVDLYK